MPITTDMIVRIAHADVAMHMAFPRSVAHWHRENEEGNPWQVRSGDCRYTQFNASIARGNVAPGIYPVNGHLKKTAGGNSYNRWCVSTQNGTKIE